MDDYVVGAPKLYEEDDSGLSACPKASSSRSTTAASKSGALFSGASDFDFIGRSGWFVDACTGSAYDLTGRCVSEVCRGALLDRFGVHVQVATCSSTCG